MARNVATSVENNFTRGLITEASGLNFPENACTDTENCNFEITGEVSRRKGIDFEPAYITKAIDRAASAVCSYLWRNVAGNGNTTLLVLQVGETLYFYDALKSSTISDGVIVDTIDLTTFQPAGAPSPAAVECQFSDGNGYLFVTHPTLETFYVSYDISTETFTSAQITLKIRDTAGLPENVADDFRPDTLTSTHEYNLTNQGWPRPTYTPLTTSSTINCNGLKGAKTLTVNAGGPWAVDDEIFGVSRASLSNFIDTYRYSSFKGTVTAYTGSTSLDINVLSAVGYGDATDFFLSDVLPSVYIWNTTVGRYPSNSDVWWMFKDSSENYVPFRFYATVTRGSAPAPRGRFILEVCNQKRSDVSGIAGLTDVTTSYFRASTSAFFSGRVFYSGIQSRGFAGSIYFTQILKPNSTDQFGLCHQKQDPTSETLFDLLPDDGGVITIPDAGTILKLWSTSSGLVVFATNGIWLVTGSSGIGFSATDYTVKNIAEIRALSASSFVNVSGYPAWWSAEGIYILVPDSSGISLAPKTLTDQSILSHYQEIPLACKKQARGYFNLVTKKIQWLFRSTEPGTVEEAYEYDSSLLFNTLTGAFNPWSISESDVKVHGLVVVEGVGGIITQDEVQDDAVETIVDDDGNVIVSYTISSGVTIPTFKYIVSYPLGGTYHFTFAEERDEGYVDWASYSDGVDYTSYFVSGYKVHGQAQRKFQSNYVYLYSSEIPSQYYFQAMWNYANTGNSGKFSSRQFVNVSDTNFDIKMNRLKVRGEGLALQFKVSSVSGQPFTLVGWSVFETGNANI